MSHEQFRAAWPSLVRAWAELRTSEPAEAARLLDEALRAGVAALDLPPSTEEPDPDTALDCAVAVVEASRRFDTDGYLAANRRFQELRSGRTSPERHFCADGWLLLRNPRRDFDLWWYWNEHLDATATDVNPFLHHLLAGRQAGLATVPARRDPLPDPPTAGPSTRRVCLFAAYDVDGVVDDYVVAYLRELSRHADVFYLVDGVMSEAELAKLAGVTKGAWAVRHGRYDFGSYALLAEELVGWDVIDEYDELLFANDSCYLLRPLDDVFATMDARPADWWGLQATKRDYEPAKGHLEPIPLAEAKRLHTTAEQWNPYYRLHVSSYFLIFRRRVVADPGFRRRLGSVTEQAQKISVILKYEIGIGDYLVGAGYDFETFIDALYPYHPLYTADFFELLGQGFPLMKRNFVGENPRRAADLVHWKERVLEHVPGAPVDMLERNLLRVAPDDGLQRSFAIRTREDGTVDLHEPLSAAEFRREDLRTPKFEHWWAFPVCAYDHTFASNERALFEEVRDDPSIKKIILTRSRKVDVDGENVVIVPLESPEGQYHLLRAGQVFVKHGPRINVPWPLAPTLHNFVNLWHGIPLKRFGVAGVDVSETSWRIMMRNNGGSRAIVTSSRMDRLAMSAAFFPASYRDMWPTGLPRNDFVLREESRLPEDLRASVERLREEVAGRRLVMMLPTFKEAQADAYYRFSADEVARLAAWAERNNAVLGIREHMADKAHTYSTMLAPLDPIDLSSRRYPDLEVLYRVADALISDYSSCLVDFMLTGRPVMSFAYDYERYANAERGLFYDLDKVLPGPVCRTFDELAGALDRVFVDRTPAEVEEYEWKRRIFFDHVDDRAGARVVERVKEWYAD
ncbi:CDP-glycerol glycerophosphotransferase, TagB/SpsB family [Nocardioides terrae]|uniref:CDP-glycerol glycerophosphotransferase, TagB/SpsB family n=1 Tax=Nocardioides terrae TaxID=574651 RepID=A0A1I1J3N2_9ACTN|nr:CDP-glycerol glycerophosphotransferase family protein [Nocardioides terrae]SFC43104.1 CDP-glycerol glycerophosphotransferase, TagB/SpsB family [Nocardioides terrae]